MMRRALAVSTCLSPLIDDERSKIIHLEHFFDIVIGETSCGIVDAGIVDEHRNILVDGTEHVGGRMDLIEMRKSAM
jgi:hypothetical protein